MAVGKNWIGPQSFRPAPDLKQVPLGTRLLEERWDRQKGALLPDGADGLKDLWEKMV